MIKTAVTSLVCVNLLTCGSMESVTVLSETSDGLGEVGLGRLDPRMGVPPRVVPLVDVELEPKLFAWPALPCDSLYGDGVDEDVLPGTRAALDDW